MLRRTGLRAAAIRIDRPSAPACPRTCATDADGRQTGFGSRSILSRR
jgi:hypothetical protein